MFVFILFNLCVTCASVDPAGASILRIPGSFSVSARVSPTFRIATGMPSLLAVRTCRYAEWTAKDEPTTKRPSAFSMAALHNATRLLGTDWQRA
jgi:hypothetical protein